MNGKVKPSESGTTYKYDLFTNIYRKNAGKITDPNEPNPNKPNVSKVDPNAKSLVIKKVVSGATADKSKDFTFKLTFTKASTETSQSITGKIGETSKTFVYGQETTITLRHDQSLVFDTIPAGTRYKLVETGSQGYTASAAYKEHQKIRLVQFLQISLKIVSLLVKNQTITLSQIAYQTLPLLVS